MDVTKKPPITLVFAVSDDGHYLPRCDGAKFLVNDLMGKIFVTDSYMGRLRGMGFSVVLENRCEGLTCFEEMGTKMVDGLEKENERLTKACAELQEGWRELDTENVKLQANIQETSESLMGIIDKLSKENMALKEKLLQRLKETVLLQGGLPLRAEKPEPENMLRQMQSDIWSIGQHLEDVSIRLAYMQTPYTTAEFISQNMRDARELVGKCSLRLCHVVGYQVGEQEE